MEKLLEGLTLRAGIGEDRFTMSRGSFSYKRSERLRPAAFDLETSERDGLLEVVVKLKEKVVLAEGTAKKTPAGINRYELTFQAPAGEHYYGCGETYSAFDLAGENVRIWVAEHQNTKRIAKKLIRQTFFGVRPDHTEKFGAYESYYAQPTFTSSGKYFMHFVTDRYSEIDFSKQGKITVRLEEEPHFFIGRAESFEALSGKLADLLGHQRILPQWLNEGAILAIQKGPAVIDEKLRKAREVGAAVTGVWSQDWCGCRETGFGYQVMWNWEYDHDLYPHLPEKIKAWKEEGIHFLGYINPFMAIEKDLYKEASAKGYCVKDREGKDYLVTITTFPAAMIDFTNPAAYAWYKDLIKTHMIGIGMAGWMADFGEYLPTDCVLYSGEDPEAVHNRWPEIWARLNREAIEECGKESEVFFFTRSGHTETVRHSDMMWTGDQHVDWSVDDGLPAVIPATFSLAMSGFGIAHSDVGGYTTVMKMRRTKELLIRWEQMNVFSPLWRSHEGNQPVNDVQFDADAELLENLARCSKLHQALAPYLSGLMEECSRTGIPVMRPLFYHYDEKAAYTEKTEYLLGREMLVAPILKDGAREREVYLPADNWIDVRTGGRVSGSRITAKADLDTIPVYVRDTEEGRRLLEVFRII